MRLEQAKVVTAPVLGCSAPSGADALDSAATTWTNTPFQSDLGELVRALAQADADIDDPQGDS